MAGDSSAPAHPDRFHYSNRRRIVSRQWLRDPSGGLLPRPPPVGTRAPNGLIWGHSLEDFMWIQRVPNVNVLTIWSRSMIKEFAENYDEGEFDTPEPLPRSRRPWPVLRIAQDARNRTIPPVGVYDDGSDHEDDEPRSVRQWRVRADDPKTGESRMDKIINRFVVEDLSDALVPNNGEKPVISPLRHPYAALWTPDLREGYAIARKNGTCSQYTLIRRPGGKSRHGELADDMGLMAVMIHDTDQPEPLETKSDPFALVIEDNGKTLSLFHDPTPVVFVDKALKRKRGGVEKAEEGSAGAPADDAKDTKEATGTDGDVEMASIPADEDDKAVEDETMLEPMETTEASGDDGTGASAEAEASTSVGTAQHLGSEDVTSTPMADVTPTPMTDATPTPMTDATPTPMTDQGTRIVMIGVLGEDSDSEDECEAEDEQAGETEPEALTKCISAGGIFDQDVLAQLPKLEEFLPEEYFPDALIVHRQDQEPTKYKRILPKFARDEDSSERERVGTLCLGGPMLGEGHHSTVRRAPLQLPPPLSAFGQHRMVTVAAKRSFGNISARRFLRHEASIFNLLPRHLQEEYCGYNLVSPIRHPVPVRAVVPKFFGYYVPLAADGTWRDDTYESHREDDTTSVEGLSPILLMEECGDPVAPHKFSIDDRSECYSLVCRLQLAGFLQGSMYVRNILWQPGPLSKPPQERSRKTPSFRIIDFGRAMYWDDHVLKVGDKEKKDRRAKEWQDQASYDRQKVERELLIQDWDY
ncbi:hypothetical protein FOMPIDRAFT_1116483 [Fomitopsis schrenkii]|uniref:Protein kinase domain-containing protein n=1 Tax=Fomitopsis schrenkii TaxID=2126942 RepID=S8FPT0_FOMSC|nr:hypothetical protein FOMPIDRAFT_1116483 [Fomitopsis schrenkii]